MLNKGEFPEDVHVFLGCCLFFLGLFNEAKESAEKGSRRKNLRPRNLDETLETYKKLKTSKNPRKTLKGRQRSSPARILYCTYIESSIVMVEFTVKQFLVFFIF